MFPRHYQYKGNRISPPQFLMLVVLRKGPMYGYEVLKALREEFQDFWEPQTGTVYPALKRLEEQGLISTELQDGKEYYSLTEDGRLWMVANLEPVLGEAQFMGRYFTFLGQAAAEIVGKDERTQQQIENVFQLPLHLASLLRDDLTPEERLHMMRTARSKMSHHLIELDRAITKYESMAKEGKDKVGKEE
ncbi:MAG: lineage-specific thermal regulator protein [Methanomassiliicoccales archaeon PtaU1.Bin124]|nr:MAG: lineage-specific thermal regulator protein [Methanomassiliicoccales archaeon PtaU1.Bin124]